MTMLRYAFLATLGLALTPASLMAQAAPATSPPAAPPAAAEAPDSAAEPMEEP
jgi:hypothetical protein